MARRGGLPWVADWRDPWLAHPDVAGDRAAVRAKLAASARLARRVAPRMAGAACVNEAIADEVRDLAPGIPVEVIPNGAEVERIAALERHPDPRLTFTFTGYFFGDRGPGVFLDALAGALRERPALRGTVRARFVGGFPEAERARLAGLGLADVVEVEPTRPHDEVLQAQRDADVLLLFMQDRAGRRGGGAGEDVGVPGGRSGRCWRWCRRTALQRASSPAAGAGDVVAPADAAGVQRAILALADRHAAGTLAVPGLSPAARERMSRRGRAAQLAALLQSRQRADHGPRQRQRERARGGVEQPVVARHHRRQHHQRRVGGPDQLRDQVPAGAVAGDPEQQRVGGVQARHRRVQVRQRADHRRAQVRLARIEHVDEAEARASAAAAPSGTASSRRGRSRRAR